MELNALEDMEEKFNEAIADAQGWADDAELEGQSRHPEPEVVAYKAALASAYAAIAQAYAIRMTVSES